MKINKNNSRTKNTILNFFSSMGGQFIAIIMQFIVRTVFIQTLGKSYLGISGLFSNILSMLSLAELGVGNAILFKLYKPLANKDEERIKTLLHFYKKVYFIIGLVVLVVGLCIIPFLPMLINDYGKLEVLGLNAVFIYLMYLMQSISSYLFFAYKSSIIKADQKEYILNVVNYGVLLISSIVQIVLLKLFNNFELYITISIIATITQNFIGAFIASKIYPFINDKKYKKIEKKETREILKDCSAIFLFRINSIILKATDNIVISVALGLEAVGLYSNYYILYTTINTVFSKIFDSVSHSLGNLHATSKMEKEYLIFKTVNFIAVILGAIFGIGIFCVSNEFIDAWIGSKWELAQPFSLLMGIEVYTLAIDLFLTKFRNAMGLFKQIKYRPMISAIINLIVSIILVHYMGVSGVLIGTIVSSWTTLMWFDPYIIHKHGFENKYSIKSYYFRNLLYIIVVSLIGFVMYSITNSFSIGNGWINFIVHGMICGILTPTILLLLFIKSEETIKIRQLMEKIARKILRRKATR